MSAIRTGAVTAYALPVGGESVSAFLITIPADATKLVVWTDNTRFTPPRDVSGATLGAVPVALTQQDTNTVNASGSPYIKQELWTLDNPTPGVNVAFALTWSGAARGAILAYCLTGSAAVAPTVAKSGDSAALAVATASGNYVGDWYGTDEGDSTTAALTAGPTSIANYIGSPGAGGQSARSCGAEQAGTGSPVSFTWTPTGGFAAVAHMAASFAASASSTAAVTGTAAPTRTGIDVRANAKTYIVTLTGDTFLTFDDTIRAAIRLGIDSASAPTWGWDAVRSQIPVANIVRTSATVCTITVPAIPGYQSDTSEVLTITIPASALTGGVAIIATPTTAITRTVTDLTPVDTYTMTGTAARTRP